MIVINMAACSDKPLKVNLYDYNIDDLLKSNNVDDINYNLNLGLKSYEQNYSETSFWTKIRDYGRIAGSKVVYQALLLYYAAIKSSTPLQVKLFIFGALGYFILPVDVLPDFIAGLGYTDDVAVILGVIKSCHAHIDEECRMKASSKVRELFGDHSRA